MVNTRYPKGEHWLLWIKTDLNYYFLTHNSVPLQNAASSAKPLALSASQMSISSMSQCILKQISPLSITSSVKYKEWDSHSEQSEICTPTPYKEQLLQKRRLLEEKNAKREEKKKLIEIKQKERKSNNQSNQARKGQPFLLLWHLCSVIV